MSRNADDLPVIRRPRREGESRIEGKVPRSSSGKPGRQGREGEGSADDVISRLSSDQGEKRSGADEARIDRPRKSEHNKKNRDNLPRAGRSPERPTNHGSAPDTSSDYSGEERPVRRRRPVKTAATLTTRREKSLEGLGALLRTRREVKGFTRRDIVMKIKIPLEQLVFIEDGQLSSMPPVFAKGFLRAYANELGLNAEAVLEDYRQMTGGFKNEPPNCEPLSQRYVEISVGPNRWMPSPRAIVMFIIAVVAFVVAFWVWPSFRNLFPGGDSPPANQSGLTQPLEAELNLESSEGSEVRVAGGVALTFPSLAGENPASESQVLNAPLQGGTLTLTSQRDNVWVQVVMDDNPVQYLSLQNGQVVTLESQEYVTVTSGMANAIMVTFDGQDLGLLGQGPIEEVTFPKV